MTCKEMQVLRDEVKFALTRQPDQEEAAINGNGHSIFREAYYMQKVPSTWHDDLQGLIHRHEIKFGWTEDGGYGAGVVDGIASLDFHVFVENKVKQLDGTYVCENEHYAGKGFAAQNAMKALQAWVDKGALQQKRKYNWAKRDEPAWYKKYKKTHKYRVGEEMEGDEEDGDDGEDEEEKDEVSWYEEEEGEEEDE